MIRRGSLLPRRIEEKYEDQATAITTHGDSVDIENSSEQISVWIEKLAAGDERAPEVIWNNYFEKIQRYARRRLKEMPRRAADEQDIALSAFNSFFQAAKADRFPKLHDRDDLWKILITITARKATAQQRRHFAEKRGGGRVNGESILMDATGKNEGLGQFLGNEPTPQLVAEMEEQYERLISSLNDDLLKSIVEQKFQGYSNEEIADSIGRNVRTVERKLALVRDIWSTQQSET